MLPRYQTAACVLERFPRPFIFSSVRSSVRLVQKETHDDERPAAKTFLVSGLVGVLGVCLFFPFFWCFGTLSAPTGATNRTTTARSEGNETKRTDRGPTRRRQGQRIVSTELQHNTTQHKRILERNKSNGKAYRIDCPALLRLLLCRINPSTTAALVLVKHKHTYIESLER